jgi:hypothetical protein
VALTTADSSAVRVPGLTITDRSRNAVRGWLDQSGAAAIRGELVRDWRAAVGAAHEYPTSLFGNVRSLALAGVTPPVSPSYPQRTLILKVVDAQGRPVPGALTFLGNVDDVRRYAQPVFVQNGEARVSVPIGHYAAITDIPDFDGRTGTFIDRMVPIADYTVSSNMQTLTVSAARATVQPTVSTPESGISQQETVEFDRIDRRGFDLSVGVDYPGSGYEARVAPTPQVRVGDLYWLTGWTLTGAAASRQLPYSYDLSFAAHGSVPASQHHDVRPSSLATVRSRYYNDQPRDSRFIRLPLYPFQYFVGGTFYPLQTPAVRNEYVSTGSGLAWLSALLPYQTAADPFGGEIDDDLRTYSAGRTQQASWQRGLLAPAPPQPTAADKTFFCPACRTATRMFVVLAPFTDSTPGHFGWVFPVDRRPVARFALYRDGQKIAGGANRIAAQVPVPAGGATYRAHLAVNRSADSVLTAPVMSTDITFRSSAKDGTPLPRGWLCAIRGDVRGQGCSVLPVLTARMPLPTDLTDRMAIGVSAATLTIRPLDGGTRDTLTSAAVYLDHGNGFRAAPVRRLANGRYRVTFQNPAADAGKPVNVRLVAKDARGGSLVQTTTAAYLVAAS